MEYTDEALIKKLPGFSNGYKVVNGIRLHYVEGGKGRPLVLLPGWPETWWAYHHLLPLLADHYRVIVVDLRGMGSSDKPDHGYDKKTMAGDIYELIKQLGYTQVFLAGHDIGSMVAFSFAANYPEATLKLIMIDIPHPDENWYKIPMIPEPGRLAARIDEDHAYQWWFAFNQIKGLPEEVLLGRVGLVIDWIFAYMLYEESAVDTFDRAVYAAAYDSRDGIRAGNGWYQAFARDIEDAKNYRPLEMPVLGIGGTAIKRLQVSLSTRARDLTIVRAEGSGHFVPEEKPVATANYMIKFFV
jgi:pimeloyl-ACP methyl ester carboxylesterase